MSSTAFLSPYFRLVINGLELTRQKKTRFSDQSCLVQFLRNIIAMETLLHPNPEVCRRLKTCFKEFILLPEGETLQRNCWSFCSGHIVWEINFYFRLVFTHHTYEEQAQELAQFSIIHDLQTIWLALRPNNSSVKNNRGEIKGTRANMLSWVCSK